MKSSLIQNVSSTHSKTSTGNLCDIDDPYKLFTSQNLTYNDSLFLT